MQNILLITHNADDKQKLRALTDGQEMVEKGFT